MKEIDPNNKKVVIKAILQDKMDLQHASERLRNDKDVVIAAVHTYGDSLKFASKRLRDDKEIVLATLNNNSLEIYNYISLRLRQDEDVRKAAWKK